MNNIQQRRVRESFLVPKKTEESMIAIMKVGETGS